MCNINLEDYYILELIDESKYSVIFKAQDKKTSKNMSILFHKENNSDMFMNSTRYLERAISLINQLNHSAILHIKGYNLQLNSQEKQIKEIFENHSQFNCQNINFILLTKSLENGNLASATNDYLLSNGQNTQKLNPTIRSKIIFGIASVMKYLHNFGILSRNLTAENIFLDKKFEPKIINNMFSLNANEYSYYTAPEVISDFKYSAASDVYSFAFIVYKMFSNELVFENKDEKIMFENNIKYCFVNEKRPLKPELMPEAYWNLVCRCWKQNPYDRLSFNRIVEILLSDEFAISEFGRETNLDELHEYHERLSEKENN